MECSRCLISSPVCSENSKDVAAFGDGLITIFRCTACIGLSFFGVGNSLETILTRDAALSGWIKAETKHDKLVHYTLSQILYQEYESPDETQHEAAFDSPDLTDIIKILWLKGKAVAFYTIKPKGTIIEETHQDYTMPTLDTAYVRKSHRRQGHGIGMLKDLVQSYPEQDLGFSKPTSDNMKKVLKKFLSQHTELRGRFWEVEGAGEEGNRKLIWYSILSENKKKRKLCNEESTRRLVTDGQQKGTDQL